MHAFAEKVTLRYHSFLPLQHSSNSQFVQPWGERLKEESNGELIVEIYPAMQLGGKPPQLVDQVRDGVVDIIWTVAGYTPGRFPRLEVFDLPFMASTALATSQASQEFAETVAREDLKEYNIDVNDPFDNNLTTRKDVFYSLCKSIIGQQISVAAANSVFLKFNSACRSKINPKVVNSIAPSKLKKCGLSRQKIRGIKELAKKYLNKKFNPKLINKMNDEEAIQYLSELRQIGRWSAEMILLFTYNRPNIWPVQDIGLLRAISNNYKKKYFPPKDFVNKLNKKFSPYCSVATWYLWRSIDNEPIQY